MRAFVLGLLLLLLAPALAGAQTPVPRCAVLATPCLLTPGLDGAQGFAPHVSPDGARVAFGYDPLNGPEELYTTTIRGGSPPVLLSAAGESARFVSFSPDSGRVLYAVDRTLFSVPAAGPASARVRLTDDLAATPQVQVSPDSVKVVFAPSSRDRLRVVPLTGPANAGRRLTDPFVAGARVLSMRISADSRSVVYQADAATAGVDELFRVPLTLSPAPDPPTARLNGPLVAGGEVADFTLAANLALYRADEDTNDVPELYRVRLGGSERVKLNAPLAPGWRVGGVRGSETPEPATVTPDGSRVVYETARSVPDWVYRELFSVPIGGSGASAVRLDEPPGVDGRFALTDYKLSADSRRVVYRLGHETGAGDLLTWLLTVPVAGPAEDGQPLQFPSAEDIQYALSRDGGRVLYTYFGSPDVLLSQPIVGGQTVQLDGPESPFAPASVGASHVAYGASVGGRRALFSAPVDGNGPRRDLAASLAASVFYRGATPDGDTVLYVTAESGRPAELYSSRLAPVVVR
jgi:Tol biopolymer transport system component